MSDVTACLHAVAASEKAITIREISELSGVPLVACSSRINLLRQRGHVEPMEERVKPYRWRITADGRMRLAREQGDRLPEHAVPVVQAALLSRPVLQQVWGAAA